MLDPEIEQALSARDRRRPEIFRAILRRQAAQHGRPAPEALDDTADILSTLTGFHTFDSLTGDTRTPEEVERMLIEVVCSVLGLPGEPSGSEADTASGRHPSAQRDRV